MSEVSQSQQSEPGNRACATLLPLEASCTAEEKELRNSLLREVLPACQPQEGTPLNTFTKGELEELRSALPTMNISRPRTEQNREKTKQQQPNKVDICSLWVNPDEERRRNQGELSASHAEAKQENPYDAVIADGCCPQEAQQASSVAKRHLPHHNSGNTSKDPLLSSAAVSLDWHGAPRFASPAVQIPRSFRQRVRAGLFTSPTNGQCPGFMQCNLVVLPQGKHAFDFLLFCQRNPQACPLVEVCDEGSPFPVGVAQDADLRTDCPKYAIYRDGKLERETTDVTDCWPTNSVAFLIGCSFSYDGALLNAGIPLRSAEQGKNVPMYRTSLKCRSAGSLTGNMVVSMKPIPALQISKEAEITAGYPHAHGGPICIGRPDAIGITDMNKPEWGDSVEMRPDEVPVFHACGVTPQSVLMESKVPFAITHSAGHMFVTDLPSDMGCL